MSYSLDEGENVWNGPWIEFSKPNTWPRNTCVRPKCTVSRPVIVRWRTTIIFVATESITKYALPPFRQNLHYSSTDQGLLLTTWYESHLGYSIFGILLPLEIFFIRTITLGGDGSQVFFFLQIRTIPEYLSAPHVSCSNWFRLLLTEYSSSKVFMIKSLINCDWIHECDQCRWLISMKCEMNE